MNTLTNVLGTLSETPPLIKIKEMMSIIILSIFLAAGALEHVKEFAANRNSFRQDSVDTLINKLVDKLGDWTLSAWRLRHTILDGHKDLDGVTLSTMMRVGKSPGTPYMKTPCYLSPFQLPVHSLLPMSQHPHSGSRSWLHIPHACRVRHKTWNDWHTSKLWKRYLGEAMRLDLAELWEAVEEKILLVSALTKGAHKIAKQAMGDGKEATAVDAQVRAGEVEEDIEKVEALLTAMEKKLADMEAKTKKKYAFAIGWVHDYKKEEEEKEERERAALAEVLKPTLAPMAAMKSRVTNVRLEAQAAKQAAEVALQWWNSGPKRPKGDMGAASYTAAFAMERAEDEATAIEKILKENKQVLETAVTAALPYEAKALTDKLYEARALRAIKELEELGLDVDKLEQYGADLENFSPEELQVVFENAGLDPSSGRWIPPTEEEAEALAYQQQAQDPSEQWLPPDEQEQNAGLDPSGQWIPPEVEEAEAYAEAERQEEEKAEIPDSVQAALLGEAREEEIPDSVQALLLGGRSREDLGLEKEVEYELDENGRYQVRRNLEDLSEEEREQLDVVEEFEALPYEIQAIYRKKNIKLKDLVKLKRLREDGKLPASIDEQVNDWDYIASLGENKIYPTPPPEPLAIEGEAGKSDQDNLQDLEESPVEDPGWEDFKASLRGKARRKADEIG